MNTNVTDAMEMYKKNDLGNMPSEQAKDNFMKVMLYVMLNA